MIGDKKLKNVYTEKNLPVIALVTIKLYIIADDTKHLYLSMYSDYWVMKKCNSSLSTLILNEANDWRV